MPIGIYIIAHEPLASALKRSCQHIFSVTGDTHSDDIRCFDVPEDADVEEAAKEARTMISTFSEETDILVFTDVIGATPSNIAQQLLTDPRVRVMTGVNLPAVITALSNINEPIGRVIPLTEGAARSGISTVLPRC